MEAHAQTNVPSTEKCLSYNSARSFGYARIAATDLTATFPLCDCDRNRRLVDIKPNASAILRMVSLPFLRLARSNP